jgi:hypothetical protein
MIQNARLTYVLSLPLNFNIALIVACHGGCNQAGEQGDEKELHCVDENEGVLFGFRWLSRVCTNMRL